jgi:hypothetical protein
VVAGSVENGQAGEVLAEMRDEIGRLRDQLRLTLAEGADAMRLLAAERGNANEATARAAESQAHLREEQARRLSAEGQGRELFEQTQRMAAQMDGCKRMAEAAQADAARLTHERDSLVQVRLRGDAKSSLGDAESSLGDAKSSLGDAGERVHRRPRQSRGGRDAGGAGPPADRERRHARGAQHPEASRHAAPPRAQHAHGGGVSLRRPLAPASTCELQPPEGLATQLRAS